MLSSSEVQGIALFCFCFLIIVYGLQRRLAKFPLPPSPKGYPIIGNVLDFPSEFIAQYFRDLHLQLDSPIVCVSLLGQIFVDISDVKLAEEIMVERASINSSRPENHYFQNHINAEGRNLAAESDNARLRRGRDFVDHVNLLIQTGDAHETQTMEARATLRDILSMENKEDGYSWRNHLSRFSASALTAMVYGVPCLSIACPKLSAMVELTRRTVESFGTFTIVNLAPFLDSLPSFLPFPWRTKGFAHVDWENSLFYTMYREAKATNKLTWFKRFQADTSRESARFLDGLVTAGNETTAKALATFMLAYVLFPEAFEGAVEQLDEVVGDRPPSFNDREKLPLVDAAVLEVLRWRPIAPLGIPHASTKDQTISWKDQNYFIPKGSIITVNTLSTETSALYSHPEIFNPERHITSQGTVEMNTRAFGWGRRKCPGAKFAEDAMFIFIASMLWAFKVQKQKDPNTGLDFPYHPDAFNGQFTREPFPFPCSFIPRSKEREDAIRKCQKS